MPSNIDRPDKRPRDLGLPVQDAVTGLVPMPPRYRRYLPDQEQMPRQDLEFLDGLQGKFGLFRRAPGSRIEAGNFGEEQFHAAVVDVKEYILYLRRELDIGYVEKPVDSMTDVHGLIREMQRPSHQRTKNIVTLLLTLPDVRREYMNIHAKKMERALPKFRRAVSEFMPPNVNSLGEFFSEATSMMDNGMLLALEPAKYQEYDNLGLIMGIRWMGLRIPENELKNLFATRGTITFTQALERVVREAIKAGVDINEKVRREFLDKDGSVYLLMRFQAEDASQVMEVDTAGKSSDEIRDVFKVNKYRSGACPAVLPVESSGEQQQRRPIVYEYAKIIVDNIPPRLLQPAA